MKNIIAIVFIVLLIGGGAWYYFTQKPAPEAGTIATERTQEAAQGMQPPQEGVGEAPINGAAYVPGNLLLGVDASGTVGTHLIGYSGMTVYTFAPDSGGKSSCYASCAENWPPYTVPSKDALLNLQAGVNGKVSSITRDDGSFQVTYNGKPLYFYIKDTELGDTKGQGVGGVWYVVKP